MRPSLGGGDTPFVKPNVSHCITENEVHYNPIPETRLVTTFYVSDASQPTRMYGYYIDDNPSWSILGVNLFDMINIDGVDIEPSTIDSTNGNYQLSQGNHVVKYTLKDNTKILGQSFYGCIAMTSVIFPSTVEEVEYEAFRNCYSLRTIKMNEGLQIVGDSAFEGYDYDALQGNVTFPSTVTSIGATVFSYETNLTSVTMLATTPPTIRSSSFGSEENTYIIYVPSESLNAYKSATNWTRYVERIQPIQN